MTTLLLDAGNSRLKWALCLDGRLETGAPVVYQWSSLEQQLTQVWSSFSKKNTGITKVVLANVAGQRVLDAVINWRDNTTAKAPEVKEIDEVTIENVVAQANAFGVLNAYEQVEKLGADRWAALVAARHYIKGDACIINCGTALTVDILTADGEYAGGTIAPGWEMMQSSLVTNTAEITSAECDSPALLGLSTSQAVDAGVTAACIGAVEYVVQRYQDKTGSFLSCVVTGGAAPLILPTLMSSKILSAISEGSIRHDPDWVLKGLAVISGDPV